MPAPRSATIATAVSLTILVALGIWQLQRLQWKTALLARIDAAEHAPPLPLGATPLPFARVVARGTWLPGLAAYGVDVRTGADGRTRIGAHILQAMARDGLPPLIVDRGWVPDDVPAPVAAGAASVTGYVRPEETGGLFTPDPDIARRHVYALDPAVIGRLLGVAGPAPFTLVALGPWAGPDGPEPAAALPRPPNNHLQYALTWFGLGGALIAVYAAWRRRGVGA